MAFFKRIRNIILNTFREAFIYHHTSLEFRAKIIALVIAANETDEEHKCEIELLKSVCSSIYQKDADRMDLLIMTTMEYVTKVRQNNGLDLDALVLDILKDLRSVPRYYKKIDIENLSVLTRCHYDQDTKDHQKRILEFLEKTKEEYKVRFESKK
jgi:hypothetical protein